MDKTIADLRVKLGDLTDRANAIQVKADADKRDLSEEEAAEIDGILNEFEKTEVDIARRVKMEATAGRAVENIGRRTEAALPQNTNTQEPPAGRTRGDDGLRNTRLTPASERARNGFAHVGEFFSAVRDAEVRGQIDPRLIKNIPGSYQSEGVGEDGGFTIPPDWRADISSLVIGEDSLLSRCDQQTTSSNALTVPIDENAPWYSSGVQAYWLDEAGLKTDTKAGLSLMSVRANKIAAVVYMTDELLDDSAAMGSFIQRKAPVAIQWRINDALINGNGVGKPLGILNAPALVSVAKETSQAAATLVAANITKMYSRMHEAWRRNAVWLYNQDIEPQLFGLTTIVKNVAGTENVGGGWPMYLPPGGLSSSPYGTLLGRPMVATEACATIGTKGDIILANMQMYLALVKGGIKQDVSIHVEFLRDMTAFRFVLRVGGQPWLSAPVTRASGTNTLSPFVTLDARP